MKAAKTIYSCQECGAQSQKWLGRCFVDELENGQVRKLRLARNAGVRRIADGVGMLVEQAAEAFQWWRGVRPQTRATIDAIPVPLT